MITFGTTRDASWVEALTNARHPFRGRTFGRAHIVGRDAVTPTVGEIWASADHVVEAHAHDVDELLYVLSGAIEIEGRRLEANDVAFIEGGTAYAARVLSPEGSHVLRIELPNAARTAEEGEYEPRVWRGPLTAAGFPDVK